MRYYVEWKDTETGQKYRKEYASERDAARAITSVEIYINTELIAHNVDQSKFRY